ncbi:MAG TPA: signal peptidase II [Gemmatimonadaceae bacterium]|nr:signal peptidase II [Gemmatimonadaceae bacterium]
MGRSSPKASLFWPVLVAVLAVDLTTKSLAVSFLAPEFVPHSVVGDLVQLTLAYNPGVSFGIEVGPYSRAVFTTLAVIAIVVLGRLYRATAGDDRPRALALALICAGALGNLMDRVRSERGVVDFIDLGIGSARFYTFNVADVGITLGAVLLAWILWQEDRKQALASAGGVPESPGVS